MEDGGFNVVEDNIIICIIDIVSFDDRFSGVLVMFLGYIVVNNYIVGICFGNKEVGGIVFMVNLFL